VTEAPSSVRRSSQWHMYLASTIILIKKFRRTEYPWIVRKPAISISVFRRPMGKSSYLIFGFRGGIFST
jgi:hypothetical protein